MARSGRLIVVANRLPVTRVGQGASARWQRSSGGLVTALEPVLRNRGGVWVGWTGSAGRAPRPFENDGLNIRPVALSAGEVERFYNGMSNRTFWPLYHDAIRTPEFRRDWWMTYREVNERYARAAARAAARNDVFWVHDYHLQLVPQMIRDRRPRQRIGFFLHIPFPPEEIFAWLPWRATLLRGMLGADVVGFQTAENVQNFSRLARRYVGAEGTDTELQCEDRRIRVLSYPISIDFAEFNEMASRPEVQAEAQQIRARMGRKRRVILSVDRLDYTKGIDVRLSAIEEMFRRRRVSVDDAVFVQIAVPSREPVPDYAQMRSTIEETVGRINGEFSEPGRVAVHYFRRSLSRAQLVAYYLAADVMLVTPLRDGMNLVAKEYVACRVDNTGVLVLSEFAGAARELRRAILVNPRDVDGMVSAIDAALRMPRAEMKRRMMILRMQVRRHDVDVWANSFLEDLRG
jgi:trehalose 6-phosphate synthase